MNSLTSAWIPACSSSLGQTIHPARKDRTERATEQISAPVRRSSPAAAAGGGRPFQPQRRSTPRSGPPSPDRSGQAGRRWKPALRSQGRNLLRIDHALPACAFENSTRNTIADDSAAAMPKAAPTLRQLSPTNGRNLRRIRAARAARRRQSNCAGRRWPCRTGACGSAGCCGLCAPTPSRGC